MPEAGSAAGPPGQKSAELAFGFDYGERRIGLAAGDTLTGGARPLGVVAAIAGRPDWTALTRHVRDYEPKVLVVGVPYNMDGTPGRLTEAALGFAAELASRFGREVVTVDERLSSREAAELLRGKRASGEHPRRIRPGELDSAAACVLLEQWLRERTRTIRNE